MSEEFIVEMFGLSMLGAVSTLVAILVYKDQRRDKIK